MKKFTGFLLFGLLLLTLGFGTLTLQSAQNALSIWFEKLVPSMFLSMVLVRLLYKEHAFDHLPSLGLPALLGMDQGAWNLVLCTMFLGFPTGSVFVDEAVRDGVTESGISLYMIGGYLMIFMSVTAVLFSFLPEFPALIIRSLAEFSSGIVLINVTPFSTMQRLLLTSFLLGFAGFCVHMQIMSMVEQVPLRYPVFLLYRILQGMISVLLLILCVQFL